MRLVWAFILALPTICTAFQSTDNKNLAQFQTLPDLRPPLFNVTIHGPELVSPGYWFVAPYWQLLETPPTAAFQPLETGPAIYDNEGHLVWVGCSLFPARNAYDFRVVNPEGPSMLSLILAPNKYAPDHSRGAAVRLNSAYELVDEFLPPFDTPFFNIHEFNVIDHGRFVLLIYSEPVLVDKTWVLDDGFAEMDLSTGLIRFKWNSLASLSLDASYLSPPAPESTTKEDPWDWFHANSVDKSPDGNYLVSSRHTSCIYKISGHDGHLLWKLGGKDSTFNHLAGFNFSWQHDARFRFENESTTIISLFDNAGTGTMIRGEATASWSSALIVALDTSLTPMTARVLQRFETPDHQISIARGNVQILPNDNVFVGWSTGGHVSEFTHDGSLVLDARFAVDQMHTYRTYKFNFTGTPSSPPAIKSYVYGTSPRTATTVHYVSWNGATDVRSWHFYGSPSSNRPIEEFASLGTVEKVDFETTFMSDGYAAYVYVEALDRHGSVMGRSIVQASETPLAWNATACTIDDCDVSSAAAGAASAAVAAVEADEAATTRSGPWHAGDAARAADSGSSLLLLAAVAGSCVVYVGVHLRRCAGTRRRWRIATMSSLP